MRKVNLKESIRILTRLILFMVVHLTIVRSHGYDGTIEVAVFGDRSIKEYLSRRLPEIYFSSSNLTDEKLANKFEDLSKIVIESSQVYFEDSRSLGKRIKLKLVKISLVGNAEGDFGIPSSQTTMEANATSYLDSFCGYANNLQNKTWDMAILMTARDLYLETTSNTNDYFVRGLANTGKVCSSGKNCLVVEGNKLHVAPIVITHELGHAIGLTHDDLVEGADRCVFPNHLMSSTIDGNFELNFEHLWSKCSKAEIDSFLKSSQGDCLRREGSAVDMMPRADSINTLSFDDQCKFAFGGEYTKFNGRYQDQTIREETHCSQLYCWDDLTFLLKTQPGAPALFGSRCDNGRVCYKGKCYAKELIGISSTQKPATNPSTISGVIQNVCDSVNTFVTSIISIFG